MDEAPSSPEPTAPPPRQRRPAAVHRHVLALALLGAALALAVVKVTNLVRHEVRISLELMPRTAADLTRLELAVFLPDQDGSPAVLVVSTFSAEHPAPETIEHIFELPNGRYELMVKLYPAGALEPIRIRKPLEVSGDTTTRYRLP